MKLNRYVALILTLLVDAFLLGVGSFLIAYANTGGTFIFFIECAIIFAVHKAVFAFLTGESKNEIDKNDEIDIT